MWWAEVSCCPAPDRLYRQSCQPVIDSAVSTVSIGSATRRSTLEMNADYGGSAVHFSRSLILCGDRLASAHATYSLIAYIADLPQPSHCERGGPTTWQLAQLQPTHRPESQQMPANLKSVYHCETTLSAVVLCHTCSSAAVRHHRCLFLLSAWRATNSLCSAAQHA